MEYLPYVIGAAASLAVTLFGILIGRLYKANDLLFSKLDRQANELHQMQLAITAIDPSKANLFRAFMLKPEKG